MGKGGSLEGWWVSFDVMHGIYTGWLVFSAKVYDHNIPTLCTIFMCELKSKCASSLATTWRLMLDVEMFGNAISEVLWAGISNLERERSDAFHYFQSFRRHIIEDILDSK